jgi:hypothetical protein
MPISFLGTSPTTFLFAFSTMATRRDCNFQEVFHGRCGRCAPGGFMIWQVFIFIFVSRTRADVFARS